MSAAKKRIEWIDLAKFIAIAIMVMGHLGMPKQLSHLIHVFHMPVFFLLSGYCYNEIKYQKISAFLGSRVKTILVPYFFWAVVMYIIYLLVPFYQSMGDFVPPLKFAVALFTQDSTVVLFSGFGVIQWFLTSLFIAECILWLFTLVRGKIVSKDKVYIEYLYIVGVSAILIIINYVLSLFDLPNSLGAKSSVIGALFCIWGFEFKKLKPSEVNHKSIVLAVAGIIGAIACLCSFKFNANVNMRLAGYGNIFLFLPGAVGGSTAVCVISVFIEFIASKIFSDESKKFLIPLKLFYKGLLLLGQNTIIILCFNRLMQYSVVLLYNNLLALLIKTESGAGLYIRQLSDLFVELLFFIPVILFINKFLPFSIGRKYSFKNKKEVDVKK